MTLNEKSLKKELSLRGPKGVCLLFGDEPALIIAYRRRVIELLTADGGEFERLDAKKLDVGRLGEDAQLLPMLGGRRVFSVEDLEPDALAAPDCKALCALMADLPGSAALVLSAKAGAFDLKKSKKAKDLTAAAEAAGIAARLDRRAAADLKSSLRSRCEARGCELSADVAAFLIERCGDDLGSLYNECDKLCAYAGRSGVIGRDAVVRVCPPSTEGDVYALSRLLLRGEAAPVLREIDVLLRLRHPPALLLSTLGGAFCDLYRAAAARAAAKRESEVAREFGYRFAWKVKNAFRDSAPFDAPRLLDVCNLLCEAETALKSGGAADERALLESTVLRSLAALRGEALC